MGRRINNESLFRGKKPRALTGLASKAEKAKYKALLGQQRKAGIRFKEKVFGLLKKIGNRKEPIRVLVLCMDGVLDSVITSEHARYLIKQMGISNRILFFPGSYKNPDLYKKSIPGRKFFRKLDYVLVRHDVSSTDFVSRQLQSRYGATPEVFVSPAYTNIAALSEERPKQILLEILQREIKKRRRN
ncbi:Uncharacterised protein [uncultured archaeon]|nr:Uncharacterised protein [uncultured archaeon]